MSFHGALPQDMTFLASGEKVTEVFASKALVKNVSGVTYMAR
jgi:hypothetical protein